MMTPYYTQLKNEEELIMEKCEYAHEREKLEEIVPRSAPFVIYLDPCGACNFKCNFCPCNISDFYTA